MGELGGYRLTLRGMPLKDRIVASVWVEKTSQEKDVSPETAFERVFVRFGVVEEELRISEKLPLARGTGVELSATIHIRDPVQREMLKAEIQIGDKKTVLKRRLDRN
jgi:hypothetical protein